MELCFSGFFFKIIFLTACLTIAVPGARSKEHPMVFTENNDENKQCNCKLTDEIYQKIQEVIESILDKKLEIIVDSQNSLITTKKDSESSLHNLHQKMDHITDHVIPELSTNIFNRVSSKMDSALKENLILLESKINLKVDNSMNEIQNNLTFKLDSINGLYKNSTTILLEQTINTTTISHQLIELKNKLEMFARDTNESEHKILLATNTQYLNEKVNSVHESIRKLKLNISEEIQTSEAKLSQQIDVFKKNEIESSNYNKKLVLIEKITTQQINNITCQISDIRAYIFKYEIMLKPIEEIKRKVTELEKIKSLEQHIQNLLNINKNMQSSVANLSSTYKQTQKSVEKTIAEQINNVNVQISDIRIKNSKDENTLKSIEEIKGKVTVLDRFQSLEQYIQYIWNVTKATQISEAKTNQVCKITNEIKKTNESKTNGDRETELQTSQNVTKFTSLCDIIVPALRVTSPDIWKYDQVPEKDDLDTYMINKTGCSYRAVGSYKGHVLAAVAFPGQLEWRVAVRTREVAAMRLTWASHAKYSFWAGEDGNTKSGLDDYVHHQHPERATPGLLAEDRYVPLYIRIKDGTLTAGAECEPEPWFTADFTEEKGLQIERRVYTYSPFGAKFLFDCPASFTGQ